MNDIHQNREGYFAVNADGEPSEYYATQKALREAMNDGSAWAEAYQLAAVAVAPRQQRETPKKPQQQPPLFEGLNWQSGQNGLFDSPEQPAKRQVNQEQYAAGYQDGLAGRKSKGSHADYATGFENGAADKRYNQRVSDHGKVFRGWSTLPGQTDFTTT